MPEPQGSGIFCIESAGLPAGNVKTVTYDTQLGTKEPSREYILWNPNKNQ